MCYKDARKRREEQKNGRREGIRRFVYPCVQHLCGLGVCAGKQTKQGQVSSYPLSTCQMSNNQTWDVTEQLYCSCSCVGQSAWHTAQSWTVLVLVVLQKLPAELKPQNKWFCEPTYIKLKGTENQKCSPVFCFIFQGLRFKPETYTNLFLS